jgi:hypothetical protein
MFVRSSTWKVGQKLLAEVRGIDREAWLAVRSPSTLPSVSFLFSSSGFYCGAFIDLFLYVFAAMSMGRISMASSPAAKPA